MFACDSSNGNSDLRLSNARIYRRVRTGFLNGLKGLPRTHTNRSIVSYIAQQQSVPFNVTCTKLKENEGKSGLRSEMIGPHSGPSSTWACQSHNHDKLRLAEAEHS